LSEKAFKPFLFSFADGANFGRTIPCTKITAHFTAPHR
jgi:hypothetical protein